MYDFILQISIVLSISVIIYILARGVPRVAETPSITVRTSAIDRLISKLPLAKIDLALNLFLEKILRKIKVMVMKIDNSINNWIGKVKKQSESISPSETPNEKNLFDPHIKS
jgi:hypothetical protein